MRVSASVGTGIGRRPQPFAPAKDKTLELKRNLPAVIPTPQRRPASEQSIRVRPLACVIAQLAAHAGDHPCTRARRRAEPSEGASLYGVAAAIAAPARKTTIRVV